MTLSAILRKLAPVGLAVLGFLAVFAGAAEGESYAETTASVEVRVWQHVRDGRNIYISARSADGSWGTLGATSLPLDDGLSSSGRYRYGDIALDVPLRASTVGVEARVWQDVRDDRRIYISARFAGGSWDTIGTIRLLLDDGLSISGRYRYGDVRLGAVPPGEGVVSLAGLAGDHGYRDGRGDEARFGWRAEAELGMTVDRDSSVIVADFRNHAIRRILPDGTVTTIAGGNGQGTLDGAAETARFNGPSDVAVDSQGSIYVADCWGDRIRKITPDGEVTTVEGTDQSHEGQWLEWDDAAEEPLFVGPCRIAFAPDGDLYIAEQTRIRRLSPSGWVSTIVGEGPGYRDGPRDDARFGAIKDIDVDAAGNVYVIDTNSYLPGQYWIQHDTIRKVSTSGWVSTLFRSAPPWSGGALASPGGIAVTADGDVYVSNTGRNQIVRVAGRDRLVPVAGTGHGGYLDGPREAALLSLPGALDFTPGGALVVADQGDSMVRLVIPDSDGGFSAVEPAVIAAVARLEGVRVSAVAGRGGFGAYHSVAIGLMNGPARDALFKFPGGIAMTSDGAIIVADTSNHAIRRISPEGHVSTVAGGNGDGDRDGPGDEAQFSRPGAVAVDPAGVIYVADTENGLIRRVAPDGAVTTVNSRQQPFGPSTGLAFDPEGHLLLNEWNSGTILRLSLDGRVSVVVNEGSGLYGFAVRGDGTVFYSSHKLPVTSIRKMDADGAISTVFEDVPGIYGGIFSHNLPGLAVAPDGTLYAVDQEYGRVVRISPDGNAAIVVDRQSFNDSRYFKPSAILITPEGDLLVADSGMSVIWKITLPNEEEGD